MLTSIIVAVSVPLLAGITYLVLRNSRPQLTSDVRGIALQTVVIIVVLLAIAGAVAGVLVARGGQAVDQLEAQDLGVQVTSAAFDTQTECENGGFVWYANGPDGDASTTADNNQCWTN